MVQTIKKNAEEYYQSGRMHCAEAVLAAVKKDLCPEVSDEVLRLAAGFGSGSGSGCICGAISGGTMALGLVVQEDRRKTMRLTRELHKWFKERYNSTCCRELVTRHRGACPMLTAEVAGKVAELVSP